MKTFTSAVRAIGIEGTAELMAVDPRTVQYWISTSRKHKRNTVSRSIFQTPALAYAILLDAARSNPDGLTLLCNLKEHLPYAEDVARLLPLYTLQFQQSAFATTLRALGTQEETARILGVHTRTIWYWHRLSSQERYSPFMSGLLRNPVLAYATLLDAARSNPDGLDILSTANLPGAARIALFVLYIGFDDGYQENDNHIYRPRDKTRRNKDICAS